MNIGNIGNPFKSKKDKGDRDRDDSDAGDEFSGRAHSASVAESSAGGAAAGDGGDVPTIDPPPESTAHLRRKTKDGPKLEGHDNEQREIRRGDYQVQVHVIECRDLKARDASGTSDPVAVVKVMGKTQSTPKKKKALSCMWDHLCIFECPGLEVDDVECGLINVAVYDSNALRSKVMIGSYEFGMGFVYGQKNREVYRTWVALTDVTDKHEGVQGYLKVSVSVIGPGDEQITHTQEEEEAADGNEMILMPPEIEQEGHMLAVRVHRADGLPKVDTIGSCDPRIAVEFAGNPPVKTSVKKDNQSPVWGEELQVPVMTPVMSDRIEIKLYDHERVGSDRLLGTAFFSYNKVTKFGDADPDKPDATDDAGVPKKVVTQWVPIYGPPASASGSTAKKMAKGRIEGTTYHGRVLMSLHDIRKEDPQMKRELMTESFPSSVVPSTTYLLHFDLYEISEVPGDADTVQVKVCWGGLTQKSDKISVKNGIAGFYAAFPAVDGVFPVDLDQVPDIFVYVYRIEMMGKKKTRMAYLRLRAKDLKESSPPPAWANLKEDKSVDAIPKGEFPGVMLYSASLAPKSKGSRARVPITKPKMQKYVLRAHIYSARNLMSVDDDGSADPYVIVKIGGQKLKTTIKKKSLSPIWYETLEATLELHDPLALAPALHVLCFDHDQYSKDDPLGRFSVSAVDCEPTLKDPKWYNLTMEDVYEPLGQLLAQFQLTPAKASKPATSIVPEMVPCSVEFTVVGLRNLAPFALLPIQNPYMVIDVPDHKAKDGKQSIKTGRSKKPAGNNPNYLKVTKFDMDIPSREIFAPAVNIKIRDHRLGGAHEPVVGTASFSLAPFIPWLGGGPAAKDPMAAARAAQTITDGAAAATPDDPKAAAGALNEGASTSASPAASPAAAAASSTEPAIIPTSSGASDPAAGIFAEAGKGGRRNTELQDMSAVGSGGEGTSVAITVDDDGSHDVAPLLEDRKGKAPVRKPGSAPAPKRKKKKWFSLADLNPDIRHPGDMPDVVCDEQDQEESLPEYLKDRKLIDNELEDILTSQPFHEFNLNRGVQLKTGPSVMGVNLSLGDGHRHVGKFKGYVRVLRKDQSEGRPPFDLQRLMSPQQYVVRVYVLRGFNMMPKDDNGLSDPYIRIKLGKSKVNDRDNHQKKTIQPEFYKCYELTTYLPGPSQLELSVMDYDVVGSDDTIGTTTIDLENLWFNREWQKYAKKPLERRSLWVPTSSNPQGKLEMWIDMFPKAEIARHALIDISPPPKAKFELRVVVWKTRYVVSKDTITNQNDLYVRTILEGAGGFEQIKRETDIHLRCKEGKGSFNYRLIYPVELPMKEPRLTFSAWDADLVGSNDAVGFITLSLSKLFKTAYLRQHHAAMVPQGSKSKLPEKMWLELYHPEHEGCQGQIQVSIEILSEEMSERRPAGPARKEPNLNPTLDPPDRVKLSLFRPGQLLKELLGPELYGRIAGPLKALCCVLLIGTILYYINSITPVLEFLFG